MLQRTFIHLSLILLFAFTQMGVATHELSHHIDEQHQQDKNSHESQCEQCLSYSHAAGGTPLAYSFSFETPLSSNAFTASYAPSISTTYHQFYHVRAPPTSRV